MTVYVPTLGREELDELAADVRQLVRPWPGRVTQEWHTWTKSRNKRRHRRRVSVTYAPLLDQLRDAVQPGSAVKGPERRSLPGSRPPVSVDPSDQLTRIYRGLGEWQRRLGTQAPPPGCAVVDPHKWALVQLAARARELHRDVAGELARDVRQWWTWAATQAGWKPAELLAARHAGVSEDA